MDEYKELYGVDPGPMIYTDYMSEEVSGLDSGTESQKATHLNYMRRQAGITEADVEDGVDVYEHVRIGFLSQEGSLGINLKKYISRYSKFSLSFMENHVPPFYASADSGEYLLCRA